VGRTVSLGLLLGICLALAHQAVTSYEAYVAHEASLVRVWVAKQDIESGTQVTPEMFEPKRMSFPLGLDEGVMVDDLELARTLRIERSITRGTPLKQSMLQSQFRYRSWPAEQLDASQLADATYVDVTLSSADGTEVVLRKMWLRLVDGQVHLLTGERDVFFSRDALAG